MQKKNKAGSILGIVAVLLIAALLPAIPAIGSSKYYTNLMVQCLINIVVVTGLNYITGMTGQMNLGTAGIFSLGAYASSLLTT